MIIGAGAPTVALAASQGFSYASVTDNTARIIQGFEDRLGSFLIDPVRSSKLRPAFQWSLSEAAYALRRPYIELAHSISNGVDSPALDVLPALEFTSFTHTIGEGINSFAQTARDFSVSLVSGVKSLFTPLETLFLTGFTFSGKSNSSSPLPLTLDDLASLKQDVSTLKATLASSRASPETQRITERIIERIQPVTEITKEINTQTKTIDDATLNRIDAVLNDLANRISSNASRQTATVENISVGQRIDTLRNITFTGTENNFRLIDNDIPDTITASNYLLLSGGTLTGPLTINGAPTFNGILTVSSFSATSTIATSTIATGGFTIGTNQFVIQQTSGNVGIGTSSPSSLFSVNATSTFSGITNAGFITNTGNAYIGGLLTGTAFSVANATTASLAITGSFIANVATSTITNLNVSNLTLGTALTVANGGTGQTSFTAGNLLYGSAANGIQNVATGTVTCGSGISCASFSVVGSGSTISGTTGYPFLATTTYALNMSATSSPIFSFGSNGGFYASSTSIFATTTILGSFNTGTLTATSGTSYLQALTLGTKLPNAELANSSLTITGAGGISVSGCGPVALGGTCALTGSGAYPFTPTLNYGVTMSATTSNLFANNAGFYASSTSIFATTTVLGSFNTGTLTATSGTSYINALTIGGQGANMLAAFNASNQLVSTSTPTLASLSATSTTATSTFLGGLTVGNNAAFTVTQIAPANSLYISSSGNVGIGTTSPANTLDVYGTGYNDTLPAGGTGGVAMALSSGANHGLISNVALSGRYGFQFIPESANNTVGLRLIPFNFLGTNDSFFQSTAGASGYNYFEGYSGLGLVLGTGNGTPIIFRPNRTEAMRILSGGNVGIGTTSPDLLLAVGSATPVGRVAHFENSTGSCYINPTTTALECTSDIRLKKNITTLSDINGLDALSRLRPVTYNWLSEATDTPTHTGFIAQEVEPILPNLVSQSSDGYYTMNYAGLTPYLVKAVQELKLQVDAMAAISATTVSNFSIFDGFMAFLNQMGIMIEQGIVTAKEFVAEKITVKKIITDEFEIKDSVTNEIYCVRVANGEWLKVKGECTVPTVATAPSLQDFPPQTESATVSPEGSVATSTALGGGIGVIEPPITQEEPTSTPSVAP